MAKTKKAAKTSDVDGPLSLTSLEVANVLRLKAVKLKMSGNALVIEGGNEQGKSSVLRSLEILLGGKDAKSADEPLHGDAKKGYIVGTFGDLVVRKAFSKGRSPVLTVKAKGKKQQSPQTILSKFLSHVSLNPLRFMEMDDRTKLATLSDVMGFDSSEFDKRHATLYEARRDANRDVKRLRAQMEGMECDETAPTEEINVADLMTELERSEDTNSERQLLEDTCKRLQRMAAEETERAAEFMAEARKAEDAAQRASEEAAEKLAELKAMTEIDTSPIKQKIADADAINAAVRAKARRQEIADELANAESAVEGIAEDLAAVEEARETARLEAREKLPLEDLDITEDAVLYKGKPLSQAGSSAQLRVSVAVAMGLNKDKRIKLLLIDDAEKLDAKNTKVVLEMAAKAGFQVLMTRVGTGSEGSVVIEDGMLTA